MHTEVKKYADNKDIKGLRYIFVDSLDVDPTFEKYREDYEYCRRMPGLFEPHKELTPLKSDKSQWNSSYWEELKMDLMENFSEKRFAHMIQAAKVVYADKVSRMLQERKTRESVTNIRQTLPKTREQKPEVFSQSGVRNAARQEQELENKRKELELENQRIEEQQRRQRERIAAKKAEYAKPSSAQGNNGTKKGMGIGLAAAAAIIIIILLIQIL